MKIFSEEDVLHVRPCRDERLYFSENLFAEIMSLPNESGKQRLHLVLWTPKFEVIINAQGDVQVRHHSWGATTFDFTNEEIPGPNPPPVGPEKED